MKPSETSDHLLLDARTTLARALAADAEALGEGLVEDITNFLTTGEFPRHSRLYQTPAATLYDHAAGLLTWVRHLAASSDQSVRFVAAELAIAKRLKSMKRALCKHERRHLSQ